jgi:Fe2+ or Zn2+ uptake regulation protein
MLGRLEEQGFRITPQRIAVLKILAANEDHPSVEMIAVL